TATTQVATVQLTANTLGSATVALICNGNTTLQSVTSSGSSFALPVQAVTGTCRIVVTPSASTSGSISVAVTLTPLPSRRVGATLDTGQALATNLAGLFVMNEGSGTTDLNLVDSQTASLSGNNPPTWNTGDPSLVFNGGGSLVSYLNAG